MTSKPKTFDEYLAALSDYKRAALEKLRKTIKAAAPKAEECISYGLAAFRLDAKPLVALGATANHCAFYLMSNSTVAAHQEELKKYDISTGTIRFPADKPLPAALVRKLVKARITENDRHVGKGLIASKSNGQSARSNLKGGMASPNEQLPDQVEFVLVSLKRIATKTTLNGMARFAIPSEKAFGVSVGDMHKLAKRLGRDHELADGLWKSGWYEARIMAAFVDEPAKVTPAQMDRWCREFDSWAICDTVCFHLFDRTPHAWKKIVQWSRRKEEFMKRAAFALLASLVAHDKQADEGLFAEGLLLVEKAATDERNFVKKGVNWALRCIGKRSLPLHAAAVATAERLAANPNPAARWVGKDALRELTSPAMTKRLAAKQAAARKTRR